jgi:hypothetical protein
MMHHPPLGASQRRRWRRAHDHKDYSNGGERAADPVIEPQARA